MNDPVNPTAAELRTWAYTPGALEPMEDFDLIIETSGLDDLVFEWAADPACPQRDYFLSCLYLFVGDAVRSPTAERNPATVEPLVHAGEGASDSRLRRWAERSRALLSGRTAFDYALWCGGGFVTADAVRGHSDLAT